jgi:hypothetical protein
MSQAKSLPAIAAAFLLTTTLSAQPMTRAQQGQMADNPLSAGQDQKKALKFGEAIYQAAAG